jgi:hypothetical protein
VGEREPAGVAKSWGAHQSFRRHFLDPTATVPSMTDQSEPSSGRVETAGKDSTVASRASHPILD